EGNSSFHPKLSHPALREIVTDIFLPHLQSQVRVDRVCMNGFRKFLSSCAVAWLLAVPVSSIAAPVYPLKASANGRYLVDQTNGRCMILGESPQALMVNLTTNEAAMFFANRSAHGFNTVWINLLCSTYTGGRPDASTIDGILPFTANV